MLQPKPQTPCSLREVTGLVDVVGSRETSDVSVTSSDSGFRIALVNHDATEMSIMLKPRRAGAASWFDLANDKLLGRTESIGVTVPAHGFRVVELRRNR